MCGEANVAVLVEEEITGAVVRLFVAEEALRCPPPATVVSGRLGWLPLAVDGMAGLVGGKGEGGCFG